MDRFLGKANPEARSPAAAPSALGVCVKVSPKQGMLILEARPGGLPPKNKKEAAKHRKLVDRQIVQTKALLRQIEVHKANETAALRRREDSASTAVGDWACSILPRWDEVRHTELVRAKAWAGLPSAVRGTVWRRCCAQSTSEAMSVASVDRYLQLKQTVARMMGHPDRPLGWFKDQDAAAAAAAAAAATAAATGSGGGNGCDGGADSIADTADAGVDAFTFGDADRAGSAAADARSPSCFIDDWTLAGISMDVKRTFPELAVLAADGPLHTAVQELCAMFAIKEGDIGYVQGLSYLAATIALNLEGIDALVCLDTVMASKMIRSFHAMDSTRMQRYFNGMRLLIKKYVPELDGHFAAHSVMPELYLNEWIMTLFTRTLYFDTASVLWDVFFLEDFAEHVFFKFALGVLKLRSADLLQLEFTDIMVTLKQPVPPELAGRFIQTCRDIPLDADNYDRITQPVGTLGLRKLSFM